MQYIVCETFVALTIYCFQYSFVALVGNKSLLLIQFFSITRFFKFWEVDQLEGSTKTHSWSALVLYKTAFLKKLIFFNKRH